ncbi:MAG: 4-hydroxy-3-methylbut-2-enyl diphosphate reductase [Lachnospiraceae bacterium]|nr:4-hydroxy-3-methylbut-2-enyl diphosphate reductase [Lachnospiraceae bacterium]MBR6485087.1 4-hydroxy-3-methylbut-2-enyl diphosphate reductase [Lachnospiraceae bacterium]
MEVKVAKNSGFCFGVKRAVDSVYEQIEKGGSIYTYGPIIHNEQVVKELEDKGVKIIVSRDELEGISEGTVIIRSHGVSREIYDMINARGLKIVDATCPFVKKIHEIVKQESTQGRHIAVIGSREHPEVKGIVSYIEGDFTVIENEDEANDFTMPDNRELCVVSQTTFNRNKFQELVEIFKEKGYHVIVANTICNATEERQTEAKRIASCVDAMIVIGGAGSSNTQKLYEICKRECDNTQYIQTLDDLVLNSIESIKCVGITAGASTPKKIIQEVQNYVRANF